MGDIALAHGDHETARSLFRQALAMYQEIRDAYSMGWTLYRLAGVASDGDRCELVRKAAGAWHSINRANLVATLGTEFPQCF